MTVRIVLSSTAVALALAGSACATGMGSPNSYRAQMDQLTDDCRERGGILVPIPGATSGRPQTDYACQISGGASRIN